MLFVTDFGRPLLANSKFEVLHSKLETRRALTKRVEVESGGP